MFLRFLSETVTSYESPTSSSSYEIPPEPDKDYIPINYKIKVINLVRENPNWKIASIRAFGGSRLTRLDQLTRWKKDIASGGTKIDKYSVIDKWVFDRFKERRENGIPVHTRDLRLWGLQAAAQFDDLYFTASQGWIVKFKARHRIRMRKITKLIKPTERKSADDLGKSAKEFQKDCAEIIPKYDPDHVINTDQTGCEYRVNINRTLDSKGAKMIRAYIGDLNKVSHSYTAQYAMTAAGTLLPQVFICLQESKDTFGPRVQKEIDQLVTNYKNVFVTCSKSGKLGRELVHSYLQNVLKPYIRKPFVLIKDNWGVQGNKSVLEKLDELGFEYEIKTVPPGCTSCAQPCDVYFFRQVKIIINRLQNYAGLAVEER